ncbi:MAG: DUF4129 domain-containing protein [Acidimicrobiales bacterium]|nr:DUF4129 domain-containing protein [Acidimicrobiales bacterium]
MEPSPSRPARSRRGVAPMAIAAVATLVAVLAVAVLAGRSGSLDDDHDIPQTWVPEVWIDGVIVTLTLLGLVVTVLLIISHFRNRGTSDRTVVSQRFLLGAVLIVVVALIAREFAGEGEPLELNAAEQMAPDPPVAEGGEEVESPSGWPLLAALGLGAVAVGAVPLIGVLLGRRRDEDEDDTDAVIGQRRDRLIGLLDSAIDALRGHPDPREAVIAAWARLEDAFVLAGLDRMPSDTPMRYLARALQTVDASGPAVARLTRSFEEAMFSTRPVDRTAQLDAVDALVAVRDELHLVSRQRPARVS